MQRVWLLICLLAGLAQSVDAQNLYTASDFLIVQDQLKKRLMGCQRIDIRYNEEGVEPYILLFYCNRAGRGNYYTNNAQQAMQRRELIDIIKVWIDDQSIYACSEVKIPNHHQYIYTCKK